MAQVEVIQPNRNGIFPPKTLDISLVNGSIVFDLTDGWDYFTIQLTYDGAVTVGSVVNKIQRSNDGANPVDFATAETLSAVGMSEILGVSATRFVHSTITTAGTSGNFRFTAVASRKRVS